MSGAIMAGTWLDVPGYNGKYQANYEGEIRRVYAKSGKSKLLTAYWKKMRGSQRLVVKLTKDGKSREEIAMSVIARTFLGPCPPGHVPHHKNGMQHDNCAGNIEYISSVELGRQTGANSRRKPVVKLDTCGQPVAYYRSAREAARKNFMSYQTIIDRCNGKVKRGPAPDGYEYAWDGEACSLRWAVRRMELAGCISPPMPKAPAIKYDF